MTDLTQEILPLLHASFVKGDKVYFSKHTLIRMKERGVVTQDIERIFKSGKIVKREPARISSPLDFSQRLDKFYCQCYFDDTDTTWMIVVIFDHDTNRTKFVTIYQVD